MNNNKTDTSSPILRCRFYNNEDEAPSWMNQNEKMFWFYEQCWVNGIANSEDYNVYIQDYPLMKDFEVEDGTSQDLKALMCDRYCHFGGAVEDFMKFYKTDYQTRLTNLQRQEKEWELRHCRLYKGNGATLYDRFIEKGTQYREPFPNFKDNKSEDEIKEILAIFHRLERTWIIEDQDHRLSRNKHSLFEYEYAVGKELDQDKTTPRDLKVILYTGFLDFVDGVYQRFNTGYETYLFLRYYKEYYLPIVTPNQKRTQRRKINLQNKCLYYNGETNNPWQHCYSPVLAYRKEIWEIEQTWVDAMSQSYKCQQNSKQLIKELELERFFKSQNIALSLVNQVLSFERKKANDNNTPFGQDEAVIAYKNYIKFAPLDHDHQKYFAFYLGEEECPFENEEEYQRMGWSQEFLQRDHNKPLCDFDDEDFQREHRGEEGVWGWYADPRFPREQKNLLFFICCNWGRWCPYSNLDELAEKYLNYHYPGK